MQSTHTSPLMSDTSQMQYFWPDALLSMLITQLFPTGYKTYTRARAHTHTHTRDQTPKLHHKIINESKTYNE
jgi:hypothetical protein